MRHVITVTKRELAGYFATPVAYVFIVIFLGLSGFFTFQVGPPFYERGQADLLPFFMWHPWLYLVLIPAIAMRLWSEERRSGTLELLMTLPVTLTQVVVAKFLAAWIFAGVALALTFPMWLTVNYLGEPDNGTILAGYLGSFLMAGGFLAIGACMSAITKNQVISFVLGAVASLVFLVIGLPGFLEFFDRLPSGFADALSSISFYTHFIAVQRGVIDVRDLVFFLSMIVFFLFANGLILEIKKGQ